MGRNMPENIENTQNISQLKKELKQYSKNQLINVIINMTIKLSKYEKALSER